MRRTLTRAVAAVAIATQLAGCFPLVAVGVGATLVVTDRRTMGAQLDDATIEAKLTTEAASRFGEKAHVVVTSYNGVVLLTGEVPNEAAREAMGTLARGTERVRSVENELVVGPASGFSERADDTYITSLVKARFLEGKDLFAGAYVKVVTERKVVYLMGLVKRPEADAAAQFAASTKGVVRVVKVFEYID